LRRNPPQVSSKPSTPPKGGEATGGGHQARRASWRFGAKAGQKPPPMLPPERCYDLLPLQHPRSVFSTFEAAVLALHAGDG